jgi:MraZ protein
MFLKCGEIMFYGEFKPKMDDKGRLIVPMKLREKLGATFCVTRGLDGCLFMFTESGWDEFAINIKNANSKGVNARDVQRYFLSSLSYHSMDKQGRFLINQNLREIADLNKEVVMIGVADKIEIWNAKKYKERQISSKEAEALLADMDIMI